MPNNYKTQPQHKLDARQNINNIICLKHQASDYVQTVCLLREKINDIRAIRIVLPPGNTCNY